MISRDAAGGYLRRLALPTLQAKAAAEAAIRRAIDATQDDRALARTQVLGMRDGVDYWAFFATHLVRNYAHVDGVVEVAGGHPLSHAWLVENLLEIHLKSDVGNIDTEQLSLDIEHAGPPAVPHYIVLTSRRSRTGVREVSFQLITSTGAKWRYPAVSLLDLPEAAVKPPAPRAKVSPVVGAERTRDADTP